jgi:D-cysteine desulfhydrase
MMNCGRWWLFFFLILSPVAHMLMRTGTAAAFSSLNHVHPYNPPEWIRDYFETVPCHGRLALAHLPTPVYQPHTQAQVVESSSSSSSLFQSQHGQHHQSSILQRLVDMDVTFLVKRDDMTGGVELGGNKVRKLEFLLADALQPQPQRKYDSIVTIGGRQSNHCRATACAARMVGLEPHLILRMTKLKDTIDGTGNLLLNQMVGAKMYTCTPGEYGRIGSNALVQRLCRHLEDNEGKKVYAIPVGGSNGIGTWGYLEAVNELKSQMESACVVAEGEKPKLDHVVFACGSGGTAAGISLGLALCPTLSPQVHPVAVCDDPDYFYQHVTAIAEEMGFRDTQTGLSTADFVKRSMTVHQGKGLGYAISTAEELQFCTDFAAETGIILDPVYSGKALYHFVTHVFGADPEAYRGTTILFWHTGGALGMYDKGDDLNVDPTLIQRLNVDQDKNAKQGMLTI